MTRQASSTVAADRPAFDPLAEVVRTWQQFWFTPATSGPLAAVRIGAAVVGLLLLWSYAADLETWFGQTGILPVETVREWRSPLGFSLFDHATTPAARGGLVAVTAAALVSLLVGFATPVAAVMSAVLWASLLHRGPMLAGPADDCLAVLLWCLVIGPSGEHLSVDGWLRARAGRPAPGPTVRAAVARGLLLVHGSAITAAAVLAQLKGDAWWDGLAAWYLAAAPQSRLPWLLPAFAASEYLTNLVTHAVTLAEVAFATGLWWRPTRRLVACGGLLFWPLLGLLAGEPFWGVTMALFGLPFAVEPVGAAVSHPA